MISLLNRHKWHFDREAEIKKPDSKIWAVTWVKNLFLFFYYYGWMGCN